jgi:2-polyprenyl-3-methyl-5-hydroxy-6-metoxy-1,4-benzoquinol methylase
MSNLRDTDTDWKALAREEPYWAVLSSDVFRSAHLNKEALESFFASGEGYVQGLFDIINRHLRPEFSPTRCLDFGCGVGRLLAPMARRAAQVVGVDVAEGMLEIAKNRLDEEGITNATLTLSDDRLSRIDGKFDFINSYIVLQHIPPERGYRIVERLIHLLEPGGIAALQMTYAKGRKFWMHEASQARFYRRDGGIIHDLALDEQDRRIGSVSMFDYDLNQLMAIVSLNAEPIVIVEQMSDDAHLGVRFIFIRNCK